MLTRRGMLSTATASVGAVALGGRPFAQTAPVLRIGVLNDQSGTYRDNGGPLSVACATLAVQEHAAALGLVVEVLAADHQGRPDVGLAIARRWFDRENVDVIMDFQNSALALAVANLAREKDKVAMAVNSGTTELTGAACTPNTVHWAYDTYLTTKTAGAALVRAGGDSWFFITADYALGHSLQRDATRFVQQAGGRVLGAVTTPFPSTDFSSPLLAAQSSRAKVICLANGGTELVNCIKQAAEFGVTRRGARLATLLMQINDVQAIGLEAAQGLVVCESFYWDLNDRTRSFAARIARASRGVMPNMSQAGCYAAALHYMRAAAALGAAQAKASGAATVARMKAMPTEDDVFGTCRIREDGRVLHAAYLFEVKSPAESRQAWDCYKMLGSVPPEEAARPLSEGGCPLIRT
ncbi:MAG: Amino acid/amide transporter substrate-binding protein family [Rubritepida sp.]|nr:Amino acid/amide transporter substrate-binding protein family [Rubritepida sp.]